MTRNEFSARPDGAERSPEIIVAKPVQLFLDKIEVEADIMSHKNGVLRDVEHVAGNLGKNRGIGDHRVGNASQMPNKRGDRTARIEQRMKRIDDLLPVVAEDGDFGQAGGTIHSPGSFYVNDAIHGIKIRIFPSFTFIQCLQRPDLDCLHRTSPPPSGDVVTIGAEVVAFHQSAVKVGHSTLINNEPLGAAPKARSDRYLIADVIRFASRMNENWNEPRTSANIILLIVKIRVSVLNSRYGHQSSADYRGRKRFRTSSCGV